MGRGSTANEWQDGEEEEQEEVGFPPLFFFKKPGHGVTSGGNMGTARKQWHYVLSYFSVCLWKRGTFATVLLPSQYEQIGFPGVFLLIWLHISIWIIHKMCDWMATTAAFLFEQAELREGVSWKVVSDGHLELYFWICKFMLWIWSCNQNQPHNQF